jgi:hypothetical protein
MSSFYLWLDFSSILTEFWHNFRANLFKPLLLFFYMGFLVPILRVKLDFPHVIYQGLVIYLLVSIGWKGGEELALLPRSEMRNALGFMVVGFLTNFVIGIAAYVFLRVGTNLRRIDAATVAGYYGSDSAGTYVTCTGVLVSAKILYAPYMPVMLAVMEIPGCLVALFLVSQLRRSGIDALGNAPDEPGYDPKAHLAYSEEGNGGNGDHETTVGEKERIADQKLQNHLAVQEPIGAAESEAAGKSIFSLELLHEVFLNPGLFLLFGGIIIGFVGESQGPEVVKEDNSVFVNLFQGLLCLFLLEMGMTASRKLRDLGNAGWRFIAFGLIAPNVFATFGIIVARLYSIVTHTPLEQGTYVIFAVLCGAASYIAVPAVQRLAIPEASPTLPLAASLGLTFSYNVTIGIPVYIQIAKIVTQNV